MKEFLKTDTVSSEYPSASSFIVLDFHILIVIYII